MSAAPKTMRLDRLLANLGYGSRREMQMLARNGRIKLDGAPLRDIEQRTPLTGDLCQRLHIDSEALDPLPGLVLMMNKPLGVTCSHKEAGPLVYRLLPDRWRRRDPAISTVGRLDKETSGLLLLTDDGAFLHKIISPRRTIAKIYRATLDRPLRGDEAETFCRRHIDAGRRGQAAAAGPAGGHRAAGGAADFMRGALSSGAAHVRRRGQSRRRPASRGDRRAGPAGGYGARRFSAPDGCRTGCCFHPALALTESAMASQQSLVDFILEQASGAGSLRARKMFGEYAIYRTDKMIALVCDDRLFVKPTEAGRTLLGDAVEGIPYPNARPHFLIGEDIMGGPRFAGRIADRDRPIPPAAKTQGEAPKKPS